MKLTWFGGTTVRIHIGGAIVVVDPQMAPASINPAELTSGADHLVNGFGRNLTETDLSAWRPRKPPRLVDELTVPTEISLMSAAPGILIDAVGEAPLLLVKDLQCDLGRWAEAAVVVLFGDGPTMVHSGTAILATHPPRLLALAADEDAVDMAIRALHDRLDGSSLVALQAGMALEV